MKTFLWALILTALATVWPIWISSRTRGLVFVVCGTMPFIAFIAGWWLK